MPKLSVIVVTARDAKCFVEHPEWDQYERLAYWLKQQTFRDFETIVVTPFPEEATAVGGLSITPLDNPWVRERTRCSASYRNTGLIHARGEYIACIDDCSEIEPDYLERVVSYLERGLGIATLSCDANRKLIDGRVAFIPDGKEWTLTKRGEAIPQGILAFPASVGLDVNGWDMHYCGSYGLEDVDFGLRLQQAGLTFALDRNVTARLHATTALSRRAIAQDDDPADPCRSNVRCCNTAWVLARKSGRVRANEWVYSDEEAEKRLKCFLLHPPPKAWRRDWRCGYWQDANECAYIHMARAGHPVARRIMLEERYPDTIDLRAERHTLGID